MKISKRKYVTVFYAVVVALAVIKEPLLGCCDSTETNEAVVTDTVQNVPAVVAEIGEKPHKIGYVPPYKTTFPDSQQVQLALLSAWVFVLLPIVLMRKHVKGVGLYCLKSLLSCRSSPEFPALSCASCGSIAARHRSGFL